MWPHLTRYRPLPEGWALAVADVVSSTEAIAAGKYKSVNMAGASVITAVLNVLEGSDYPFVFGGDGAVIAVPPDGHGGRPRGPGRMWRAGSRMIWA